MLKLFYKPSALRVIKKFTTTETQVYRNTLTQLKESPEAGGFLRGSLKGLRKWKFKVNSVPYRIVYKISDDSIEIIAVGKRKDFYDLLD